MQPLFFLNAATGIQNSTTTTEQTRGTLMDAGLGLQYEFGRNINGSLQIAFPLRDQFNTDITVPSDTFKIVFGLKHHTGQYRI